MSFLSVVRFLAICAVDAALGGRFREMIRERSKSSVELVASLDCIEAIFAGILVEMMVVVLVNGAVVRGGCVERWLGGGRSSEGTNMFQMGLDEIVRR